MSNSSSLMFQSTRSRRMPALVHMMSSRPNASTAFATSRAAASDHPTAHTPATARPPPAVMPAAVSSATSESTALTTTAQPASASARAYARPMPRPLPVTTATFPSSFMAHYLDMVALHRVTFPGGHR